MLRKWDIILSLGAAGPRRWPERGKTLTERADSMSPNQSAVSGWWWGFHTVRGSIGPRDHCFRPQVVGVITWKRLLDSGMCDAILLVILSLPSDNIA